MIDKNRESLVCHQTVGLAVADIRDYLQRTYAFGEVSLLSLGSSFPYHYLTNPMAHRSAELHTGYAARTERLPLSLDAVTPDCLTRTRRLRYPQIEVSDIKVRELVNGHTTKLRAELALNDAGLEAGFPSRVCINANWSGAHQHLDFYANEARFYRNLRDEIPIPTPKCFFADWDAEAQGIVVLEDLADAGGTFGKSIRPITIEEAFEALRGLAALHAAFWGRADTELTWLPISTHSLTTPDKMYAVLVEVIHANERLPERIKLLPRWLTQDPPRLGRAFDALRAHETSQLTPRCVIHGDAHLGNTFVGADGRRLWLDWQMVRRGRPWRDIAWFLIGALEIEDRRSAEGDLLRSYVEQLRALGVADVTFDAAWGEYRRWPIWDIVAWQGNLDVWGQPSLAPLARFVTAAEDLQSLKLLNA